MPRSRSSGALSIESNDRNATFGLCLLSTFVMAAVVVVFPWSICPIVPMLTCGFDRSNFSFPMVRALRNHLTADAVLLVGALHLRDHFFSHVIRCLLVAIEVHGIRRAPLG